MFRQYKTTGTETDIHVDPLTFREQPHAAQGQQNPSNRSLLNTKAAAAASDIPILSVVSSMHQYW